MELINPDVIDKTTDLVKRAVDHKITDSKTLAGATEIVRWIRGVQDEIRGTFRPHIQMANQQHKSLIATEKRFLDPLAQAELTLKSKIGEYNRQVEADRRAAEELARELSTPAEQVQAVFEVPKPRGLSEQTHWKFRIVDESLLPREYLMPDTGKIGGVIRAAKGTVTIPGVEAYAEKSTVVRS